SRARASSRQALLGPEKAGKPPILSATGRPAMDKPPALVDGTVVSWVARFAFPFPSPPPPPSGTRGEARHEAPPPPCLPLGSYGRGVQVQGAAEEDCDPSPI